MMTMQVNLSHQSTVLTHIDFTGNLSAAIRMVNSRAGTELSLDLSDGLSNEDKLTALTKLAVLRGPNRAAAAASLVELALAGSIMLPATSTLLSDGLPQGYPISLPPFLVEIDEWVKKQKPAWFAKRSHLQLILATSYRQPTKFEIEAFAKLHDWLIKNGTAAPKFSPVAPVYVLLRSIEFVDNSSLREDRRRGYILWRASNADRNMSFEQFMADPMNLDGMRVHGRERERVELQAHIERRTSLVRKRTSERKKQKQDSPFVQGLIRIAQSDSIFAPEEYFSELGGSTHVKGFRPEGWLENPINYPGRQTVDVSRLGERWFLAFQAYLAHRSKDYETDKEVRSALNILADYLLLYLPWWMALNPTITLDFPFSPKLFLRYFYVSRTRFHSEEAQSLEALPRTLNEMLPLRKPTPGSRNVVRLALQSFFNFVITYFEDDSSFVTKGMPNPFRADFDKEVSRTRPKTDKIPFAEDVFPFLIHYGQALEAFGEFLQQEAYLRNRFRYLPNGEINNGYDTKEWGYVPIFWYRGKRYRVDWIPNIYTIAKRTLFSNPSGQAGLYVQGNKINNGVNRIISLYFPHLTVVRLLMALTETGLRGQSLQWLDRGTFDKLASDIGSLATLHGNAISQSYHSLYINTDKSHEEWSNLISWRVRRSLLAERNFQDSVADKFRNERAPYEDRENSRFLPVLSLFRSSQGAKPFSDSNYSSRWVEFLYGFQFFYNRKDGIDKSDAEDALVLLTEKEAWEDGAKICDAYLPIHAPHGCRATYATLKDGDLEVSEIAEQLGQSNTVVTNRYQVPQVGRLLKKLKAIDERVMSEAPYDPSGDGPEHLHPERPGSPVRVAFARNREESLSDFGFVPGVALWSLSELDGDMSTLELLRRSPSSHIRWHSTHVCPVGNQCPSEVIANTGGMNRCGICPLAAKCIDHLPGIEAKQAELHERIRTASTRQRSLVACNATQAEIDNWHRQMELDTKELLGWKLSAEILRTRQTSIESEDKKYHTDQPELVRKHLQLVTRNQSESEFFLQRIADSNAYPSLESPEVRAKALRYTRIILAGQGRLEDAALLDVPAHTELAVFASLVKPYVEAKGLSIEQLAAAVDDLPRITALPSASMTQLLAGD